MIMEYDLVVLGGGSAGYSAAVTASKHNKKVCLIEKGPFGGLCILKGCMPSKTLIWSARVAELIKKSKEFGINVNGKISYDIPKIINRKNKIIKEFADYRFESVKKNKNITLINGEGKFVSQNKIRVNNKEIEGKNFVIATGSKVFIPNINGLKETGFITSDEALELKKLPKSLAVLGGGPVTLELAYYFHNLNVEITVIQRGEHVLSENDSDLAEVLEDSFRKNGIKIYSETELKRFSKIKEKKEVEFLYKNKNVKLKFDEILVGFGRVPNVKNLGLENIKVKLNDKGVPILND